MATKTIELRELIERFGEIMSSATGEEVIVTEKNVPRARLVPLPQQTKRVLGLHPGSMVPTDDFDAPLPESFWIDAE